MRRWEHSSPTNSDRPFEFGSALRVVLYIILCFIPVTSFADDLPTKIDSGCDDVSIVNSPGNSGGTIVETDDGHIYKIDEIGRIDSQLWLTGDDITVCWSTYLYQGTVWNLIQIYDSDGDAVDATQIH